MARKGGNVGFVNGVKDFLTANVQSRATFLMGVGLGLRLG